MTNRKRPRLQNYDYNQNGVYFITFCTKHRLPILSVSVGRDDPARHPPVFELSEIGKNVDKYINSIPEHHPDTTVDKYVIMPNHVHLLLHLECNASGAPGSSRPTMTIPRIIAVIKRFSNKDSGMSLWQPSYYDHIIRDENDYLIRWKYIDDNPAKWLEDEYYTK
jgi:REP element-mobilizing transposase RayT